MTTAPILRAFDFAGITPLPSTAYDQLLVYLELLLRWNARFSLTSIREPEQIIQRHLVESAFAAQYLPGDVETLLDFGSGAGLPGIVFAVCRPEIRITLAEAHRKKAAFITEAIRTMGLGSEVYNGRVESLPVDRVFSAVSMRAVEKMELAIPTAIQRADQYLVLFATEKSVAGFQQLAMNLVWRSSISLPNTEQMVLAVGEMVKVTSA